MWPWHGPAPGRNADADLDREKGRLAEIVGEVPRNGRACCARSKAERSTVKTRSAQRDIELKQCVDRNLSLYALNGEILAKLEHRRRIHAGVGARTVHELKRVELENLIDGYQTAPRSSVRRRRRCSPPHAERVHRSFT